MSKPTDSSDPLRPTVKTCAQCGNVSTGSCRTCGMELCRKCASQHSHK